MFSIAFHRTAILLQGLLGGGGGVPVGDRGGGGGAGMGSAGQPSATIWEGSAYTTVVVLPFSALGNDRREISHCPKFGEWFS